MRVEVQSYDTKWPDQFLAIKTQLELLLSGVPYISIEHVGSTSVPGLPAKPIIDVTIVIKRNQLSSVVNALAKGNFEYLGERGIPDRHAFKNLEMGIKCNLYAAVEHSVSLKNHLLVRDICRANEQARLRYGQVKLELSQKEWENIDEYAEAKSDVISWILAQGSMDQNEILDIRMANTTVGREGTDTKDST